MAEYFELTGGHGLKAEATEGTKPLRGWEAVTSNLRGPRPEGQGN